MRVTRLQALHLVYVLRAEAAAEEARQVKTARARDTRRRHVLLLNEVAGALERSEPLLPGSWGEEPLSGK